MSKDPSNELCYMHQLTCSRKQRQVRLHYVKYIPMLDGQVQLMEMSQMLDLSFFLLEIQLQARLSSNGQPTIMLLY